MWTQSVYLWHTVREFQEQKATFSCAICLEVDLATEKTHTCYIPVTSMFDHSVTFRDFILFHHALMAVFCLFFFTQRPYHHNASVWI